MINYEQLKNWPIPEVTQNHSWRDSILYALGIGLGRPAQDQKQLRYVYEDGLQAFPTMAVVLATPGFWMQDPALGIQWKHILHGEQGLKLHRPLPPEATLVGRTRITSIIDKGAGRGANLYTTLELSDKATGDVIASLRTTAVCRADGGFGGPEGPVPKPHAIPGRAPDMVCDLPSDPRAALLYRLSGDFNPLHIDPAVATEAGFAKPILHGLCTYGMVGHALVRELCGYDGSLLREMNVRFSSPVYPGETTRTEIWREGDGRFSFRCRVIERDVIVINNGLAVIGAPPAR